MPRSSHTIPASRSWQGGPAIVGKIVSTAAKIYWRRIGLMILANILWLLMSLPIVTWPAATAGLFSLVRRVVTEELDDPALDARLGDFWDGVRAHWQRGSLVTLIDLAAGAVIVVAFLFYARSPVEPLQWLVGPIALVLIAWLAANLYLYPLLLHRPHATPWQIVREALLTALVYPLTTGSLLITSLVLAVPAALLAGPILFIFFSAMAALQTVALRQILIERGEVQEAHP
jgi:uncharacterized membrane protein YesL